MQKRRIPELDDLFHKHDSQTGPKPEENILVRVTSPVLWRNETLAGFLERVQEMWGLAVAEATELRNYLNHTVDKHYDGHHR